MENLVYRLTNWVKVFAVRVMTAHTIAQHIVYEIFPRVDAFTDLVIDNRGEFVNEVMREALRSLNIKHITVSPYHPQINALVEGMDKLSVGKNESWDLFLYEAPAVARCFINDTSRFFPYFTVFNRDAVLPSNSTIGIGQRKRQMNDLNNFSRRKPGWQCAYSNR